MLNVRQGRFGGLASLIIAMMLLTGLAFAQTVPDLNHDGVVNFLDYGILAKSWHRPASWDGNDTVVDFNDLAAMSGCWLEGAVPVTCIQWLGHSAVKIWAGDKIVYVDPRNLTTSSHDATVVLVTHLHSDHYSVDGIKAASNDNSIFMAPPDVVAAYGKGQAIAPDQVVDLPGIRITAVRAYNITLTNHAKANNWLGYIVQFGPQRVYLSGDTDLTDEVKAVRDIDVAFLPAAGPSDMSLAQAAEATKYINPVVAIPYHWGDLFGSVTDARTFARTAACNAKVMTKNEILCSTDWGRDYSLTACYPLDEQSGGIVPDAVGSFVGTAKGNPAWQPTGGLMDGALQFDGSDDYVSTPFILDPSAGPFSVFAWVRGGQAGQCILSQIGGSNWLSIDPVTGCFGTELKTTGRSAQPLWSTAIVTDGSWHRVGLVWNGTNRILYVDDAEVVRDSVATPASFKTGLSIGAGADFWATAFWSGLVDDVRIHLRAIRP
jgi:L-ascorbate metabolism protein UlaG (beta-lactamase superfamily)